MSNVSLTMSTSGSISLTRSTIRCNSPTCGDWQLQLEDVLAIGELTSESGPCCDDYFLCFVTHEEKWVEASCYADGFAACFQALNEKLGPLQLRLANSTSFASHILWPPHLA